MSCISRENLPSRAQQVDVTLPGNCIVGAPGWVLYLKRSLDGHLLPSDLGRNGRYVKSSRWCRLLEYVVAALEILVLEEHSRLSRIEIPHVQHFEGPMWMAVNMLHLCPWLAHEQYRVSKVIGEEGRH